MINLPIEKNLKLNLTTLIFAWFLVVSSSFLITSNANIFPYIFFIDVWLFSHPHAISTFFKSATLDKFPLNRLLLILGIITTSLSLATYFYGSVVLFNIYFYWQWFHYSRQNYGIAIASHAYKGHTLRRIEIFFLHFMPALALLVLASKGSLNFLNYYIAFPDMTVESSMLKNIYFLSFLSWGFFQLISFTRREFSATTFINSLSAFALYYWVYIYSDNFILGWLGMTFYHNIQYLIFNWSRGQFKMSLLKDKSIIFFYLLITAFSILLYGSISAFNLLVNSPFIPISLVLIFSLNILHYLCDSVVWRNAK